MPFIDESEICRGFVFEMICFYIKENKCTFDYCISDCFFSTFLRVKGTEAITFVLYKYFDVHLLFND